MKQLFYILFYVTMAFAGSRFRREYGSNKVLTKEVPYFSGNYETDDWGVVIHTEDLPVHFKLRPKKPWRRWASKIGFAGGLLTGDTVFDAEAYIRPRDIDLLSKLRCDAQLRALILNVLREDCAVLSTTKRYIAAYSSHRPYPTLILAQGKALDELKRYLSSL